MTVLRTAVDVDFRTIFDLQQGPFRMEVFDAPPVPFAQFSETAFTQVRAGLEHYFVLEDEGVVSAFVWFQRSDDLWFTLLWGRRLRTLVHAAGITGFRHLGFSRQHFWVRQKNRRMIKVAEDPGYGFEKLGEDTGYALREDSEAPLVVVKSSLYEIRRDVYFKCEEYYRKQSVRLETRL